MLGLSLFEVMEEVFSKFTTSITLTEKEKVAVVVSDAATERSRCTKSFLVGKVLSSKPVNKGAFISVMKGLWHSRAIVEIVSIRNDRFLFAFTNDAALQSILDGGPWTFGRDLLVLAKVHRSAIPASIPLLTQEFWVRIHGLPILFMTKTMGEELGSSLGKVLKVNCDKHGDCLGDFLRIRVALDITVPLRRGLHVHLPPSEGGESLWALLQYEKLPSYCLLCGCFDHKFSMCALSNGTPVDDFKSPFGVWLRAERPLLGTSSGTPRRYGLSLSSGSLPDSGSAGEDVRSFLRDADVDLVVGDKNSLDAAPSAETLKSHLPPSAETLKSHLPDLNIGLGNIPMEVDIMPTVVESFSTPLQDNIQLSLVLNPLLALSAPLLAAPLDPPNPNIPFLNSFHSFSTFENGDSDHRSEIPRANNLLLLGESTLFGVREEEFICAQVASDNSIGNKDPGVSSELLLSACVDEDPFGLNPFIDRSFIPIQGKKGNPHGKRRRRFSAPRDFRGPKNIGKRSFSDSYGDEALRASKKHCSSSATSSTRPQLAETGKDQSRRQL